MVEPKEEVAGKLSDEEFLEELKNLTPEEFAAYKTAQEGLIRELRAQNRLAEEEEEELAERRRSAHTVPLPWHGEDWITFLAATEEIQRRLGLSRGAAERTLRELCATGDVRALKYEVTEFELPEPDVIRPSEWRTREVDFDVDGWDHCVGVSDEDLSYWLRKQPKPEPRPGPKPGSKLLGKVPRIMAHLAKLYPGGVPDPAHCPRKELQGQLLKLDPGLRSLDAGTLKAAIDQYNTDRKQSETVGSPIGSD